MERNVEIRMLGPADVDADSCVLDDGVLQAKFDSITDAHQFAETHNIFIKPNEIKLGYELGGMLAAISELPLDVEEIGRALELTTDAPAYGAIALKLAVVLTKFAKG